MTGKLLVLIYVIGCCTLSSCEVSFDYSSGNDILVISSGSLLYPVCSTNWDASWNNFVCNASGFGYAVTQTAVPQSSSNHSINGFYQPQTGVPVDSITDVLSTTPVPACQSGEIVAIRCSYDECGQNRLTKPQSKIIGGTSSLEGTWPWQVAIFYNIDGPSTLFCGGILVHPLWVITAAHCVNQDLISPQKYLMIFGDTTLVNSTLPHRQIRLGAEIYMHEYYDPNTLLNDVAMIRLAQPVTFTFYVRPACLPFAGEIFPVTSLCYATGWGQVNPFVESIVNSLQEVRVTKENDENCEVNSYIQAVKIFSAPEMLCAGKEDGSKGTCSGDSGGALVCLDNNNRWLLAGVTSWGVTVNRIPCKSVSVFAEVAHYISWFMDKENNLPFSDGGGFDYDYSFDNNIATFGKGNFIMIICVYVVIVICL